MKIQNIVVPTDFSDYSMYALEYAIDLAEKWEADIHLLYVIEKMPTILSNGEASLTKESLLQSAEDIARKKIKEIVNSYTDDINVGIFPVLKSGNNYEQIINFSKEIKSDLIVIATHGRTGILYTLLGSVAEKVIQLAKCPVLVVKPEEEE